MLLGDLYQGLSANKAYVYQGSWQSLDTATTHLGFLHPFGAFSPSTFLSSQVFIFIKLLFNCMP